MTTITTARLLLRPLAPQDKAALVRELNDLEISRWAARIPYPYGPEDADDFLRNTPEADDNVLRLAITQEGALIGVIGLERGEIGYWIASGHWGKGLATEAARAMTDHGFGRMGLTEIVASYQTGNAASRKILLKLGFREMGEGESFCRATGLQTRIVNLLLTKEDWASVKERRT